MSPTDVGELVLASPAACWWFWDEAAAVEGDGDTPSRRPAVVGLSGNMVSEVMQ